MEKHKLGYYYTLQLTQEHQLDKLRYYHCTNETLTRRPGLSSCRCPGAQSSTTYHRVAKHKQRYHSTLQLTHKHLGCQATNDYTPKFANYD